MIPDECIIIRTITSFIPVRECTPESTFRAALQKHVAHVRAIQAHLATHGITVQTVRVSLPSPSVFGSPEEALNAALILDTADVDYANLGMIHPEDGSGFVNTDFIRNIIEQTGHVSLSVSVTSRDIEDFSISKLATQQAAHAVSAISKLDAAGFSNLRFAAAASVRPNGPFFPASYASMAGGAHGSSQTAIGIQGATILHKVVTDYHDDANNASKTNSDELLYQTLTKTIEYVAVKLTDLCSSVVPNGVKFDFSTAPFPHVKHSVGDALIKCVPGNTQTFPSAGGLSAAARVAAAIDRAMIPRTGFCGIMLPVSEDVVLAKTAPELNSLLMCSAVCGTGLDTVPVAGDLSVAAIANVINDVASLSLRLGRKQLTARLMPVPGARAGEQTKFDSPYMSNGPVVSVDDDFGGAENDEVEAEENRIELIPFAA